MLYFLHRNLDNRLVLALIAAPSPGYDVIIHNSISRSICKNSDVRGRVTFQIRFDHTLCSIMIAIKNCIRKYNKNRNEIRCICNLILILLVCIGLGHCTSYRYF